MSNYRQKVEKIIKEVDEKYQRIKETPQPIPENWYLHNDVFIDQLVQLHEEEIDWIKEQHLFNIRSILGIAGAPFYDKRDVKKALRDYLVEIQKRYKSLNK